MKARMFIIMAVLLLFSGMTACGTANDGASGNDSSAIASSADASVAMASTPPSESSETADANEDQQASASSSETQSNEPSQSDPTATIDQLMGEWTDVDAPDRFAKITVNPDEPNAYYFEDNDGKYKATFKDGILTVVLSLFETTDENQDSIEVYIDEKLGNMVYEYEGILSKFTKKK